MLWRCKLVLQFHKGNEWSAAIILLFFFHSGSNCLWILRRYLPAPVCILIPLRCLMLSLSSKHFSLHPCRGRGRDKPQSDQQITSVHSYKQPACVLVWARYIHTGCHGSHRPGGSWSRSPSLPSLSVSQLHVPGKPVPRQTLVVIENSLSFTSRWFKTCTSPR